MISSCDGSKAIMMYTRARSLTGPDDKANQGHRMRTAVKCGVAQNAHMLWHSQRELMGNAGKHAGCIIGKVSFKTACWALVSSMVKQCLGLNPI